MGLKQIVRTVWRWEPLPVFGTDRVWVKGRIPTWALFIFGALFVMLNAVITPATKDACDVERMYGTGTTLAKLFAWLYLLLPVLMIGLCVHMGVQGYRTWRCRTTVPEGKKPLFDTRLLEGAAAVRVGVWTMLLGVICVGCMLFFEHVRFNQVSPYLFNTPHRAIEGCQAPHQHQTTSSIQENSP